jgi:hypothetical protein
LVIGIILLFLGVTIAPTINFQVVKASTNDDLVEVTTQACGIQGFGNTTVKLTREQYQDLEQYLVEFRAKLNQTSTRGEAVPLFKDAVVELDKYGLLPKGMSVERAQRLIISENYRERFITFQNELDTSNQNSKNSNVLCLVAGKLNYTYVIHRFNSWLTRVSTYLFFNSFTDWYENGTAFLFIVSCVLVFMSGLLQFFADFNPYALFDIFGIGIRGPNDVIHYSSGWLTSFGLLGVKSWTGSLIGCLPDLEIPITPLVSESFPGMWGFCGIKIMSLNGQRFFFGTAVAVSVDSQ